MHIMTDTETLDLMPTAAILELGAAEFDFSGKVGRTFRRCITLQSCLFAGLTMSEDTKKWWQGRPAEDIEDLSKDCVSLRIALFDFMGWINQGVVEGVWAHGAAFDLPIIRHAYRAVGLQAPWNYRLERDTRTVFGMAEQLGWKKQPSLLTAHRALPDTLDQIESLVGAMRVIKSHMVEWR